MLRRTTLLLSALTLASSARAQTAAAPAEHGMGPWVLVGVGAGGSLVGLALVLAGTSDISDAKKQCPNNVCSSSMLAFAQSEDQRGKTLALASAVVFSVSGAAVIGGILWHFLEPTGKPASAWIAPTLGGVSFGARF